MFQAFKRDKAFYSYLVRLTSPIALQNLITFSLGLIDTLMVSQLGNSEMAAVRSSMERGRSCVSIWRIPPDSSWNTPLESPREIIS